MQRKPNQDGFQNNYPQNEQQYQKSPQPPQNAQFQNMSYNQQNYSYQDQYDYPIGNSSNQSQNTQWNRQNFNEDQQFSNQEMSRGRNPNIDNLNSSQDISSRNYQNQHHQNMNDSNSNKKFYSQQQQEEYVEPLQNYKKNKDFSHKSNYQQQKQQKSNNQRLDYKQQNEGQYRQTNPQQQQQYQYEYVYKYGPQQEDSPQKGNRQNSNEQYNQNVEQEQFHNSRNRQEQQFIPQRNNEQQYVEPFQQENQNNFKQSSNQNYQHNQQQYQQSGQKGMMQSQFPQNDVQPQQQNYNYNYPNYPSQQNQPNRIQNTYQNQNFPNDNKIIKNEYPIPQEKLEFNQPQPGLNINQQFPQPPANVNSQLPQNYQQPQQPLQTSAQNQQGYIQQMQPINDYQQQQEGASGFQELSVDNPEKNPQQQAQASNNINQISIEILRNRDTIEPKYQMIHQVIHQIFGKFDFEISIKNIDPQQLGILQNLAHQLQVQGITFKTEFQNQDEALTHQRIYQVKPQDNNISLEDRMVILYYNNIAKLVDSLKQQHLKILINVVKFQFKLDKLKDSAEKFANQEFPYFKRQLDSTIILYEECKSKFEAKIKSQLLNQDRMKSILISQLAVKQFTLFINFEMNLANVTDQLLKWAKEIGEQLPCLFCIVCSPNDAKASNLQKEFKNFITKNLKLVDKVFEISVYEVPDQNDIDCKISLLNEKYNLEIFVTPPELDIQKGTFTISVQISFWIESYQSETLISTRLENIRKEILNIYLPTLEIQLQTVKQIKIWQNVLAENFENTLNSQECLTKYINKDLAVIQLGSFQQNAANKKDQILAQLKQFDYIEKDFQAEEEVLKFLSDSQLQKLFKSISVQIGQNMQKSKVKLLRKENDKKIWFEIYLCYAEIKLQQIEDMLKELFINILVRYDLIIELQQILDFLKVTEAQFAENYCIVISKKQGKKPIILGLLDKLDEIQSVQEQIVENKKKNQQTELMNCLNPLVYKRLQQHKEVLKLASAEIRISFQNDGKIMITGDKKQTAAIKQKIQQTIQTFENELVQTNLDFCEKQVKYVRKHLQILIDQYQRDKEVLITYSQAKNRNQQPLKSIATKLAFSGKQLQIVYADISRTECDAIVNSCNDRLSFGDPTTLSGVAQSIFDMAGSSYHSFCEDYINKNKKLKVGIAITYDMPKGKHIKHIINVATPIYSNGIQTNSDLADIEKNIQAIFQEGDRLQLNSLALPIFGGGACGYSFSQASEVVLTAIINNLFSNKYSIQTVYITETMDTKITQLQQKLWLLLEPPQQVRKIQFQWQWNSDQGFVDYDDEDINRQIDETYEKFQNTNQEQKHILQFSFTKQPGTHSVDLKNSKFIDLSVKRDISMSHKIINNSKKFFINNEQVDDQLNEYFMLQEMNKQYQIVMNSKEMYQMNLETQFKRLISSTVYIEKKKQYETQIILIGKNYDLNNYQYQKVSFKKNSELEMKIQSFDGYLNQTIITDLTKELQKVIVKFPLTVPDLPNEELQNFESFLQENSIKILGQVVQGNNIVLELFNKKQPLVKQYMDRIKLNIKQYPPEWISQTTNLIKHQIQPGTQEYIKIQQFFNQTDQGAIHAIYRIQNKQLWDNYISEKTKLLDIYKQQNIQLSALEQSRYLWHGVSGQHPQVIYSGLKEAFDQTYSNVGMWGAGIYFAENASYSRAYSYQIAGKRVFLCCLVTTGKVEVLNPNNAIKRPSAGYDCVSGFTQGSNVFILYSMDIRRAYPAYEVIYT